MAKISYTIYLQCDAGLCGEIGNYLAHPLWDDSLNIEFEREEGQIFFRKRLSADLTFKNTNDSNDYDCLMGLDLDDVVYISIYADCVDPDWEGSDPSIFEGKFTLRDCHINQDDCTISINPTPNDYYDIIIREWEREFNILSPGLLASYSMRRDFWNTERFSTGKKLEEVIQYLLNSVFDVANMAHITYVSTFFDNDLTVSSDNYVTGVDPNPLNELYMIHKSDVIAEAGQGVHPCVLCTWATIGKISLKELVEDLQSMYDIRWYIYYSGGSAYFRIEHISFFANINGIIDLTVLADNFSKNTYAWHANKYTHVKVPLREEFRYSEILPREENRWTISDWFRDYFYDYPVDWGRESKNTLSHQVRNFNNDINWICYAAVQERLGLTFPQPSPDGWVLLECYVDAGFIRWCRYFNPYLNWWHLTQNYWQDYRSFIYGIRGYIDEKSSMWNVQTFDSKRRVQRQDEINFAACCQVWRYDFGIWDLIHTEIGWGEIDSLIYNLGSGDASVILLHETEDIDKPVISTSSSEPPTTNTGTGTWTDPTTYVPTTTTTTTTTAAPTTTPI